MKTASSQNQPTPKPGVIASFEDLNKVNFKTIIGSVIHYDDPIEEPPVLPPFLPEFSMHYWHMKKGEIDDQKPHFQDEIYVILEGTGAVKVDGKISAIKTGDIIFVPAKMTHNFIADNSDMRILVFFAPNWDGKKAGA